MKNMLTRRVKILIAAVASLGLSISFMSPVFATTMTNATVMEYHMNASGSGKVAFRFTAGAADPSGTLTIDFGSWGGTVNATQSITTTGCQALTGATNVLPSTSTLAAAGSGSVVTVSNVNALTSGQSY